MESSSVGAQSQVQYFVVLVCTVFSSFANRLRKNKREKEKVFSSFVSNPQSVFNSVGIKGNLESWSKQNLNIEVQCRWYRAWTKFILAWAVYSSFFTPMEFGFFRGLPENLFILDIVGQIAFLLDIVLQFFVAYRDSQTYRMVYKRPPIALRSVFSFHNYIRLS